MVNKGVGETIPHASPYPLDDRPEYLMDTPYRVALDTETDGLEWFDDRRPFLATASDYDRDWCWHMPKENNDIRALITVADELIFHNAAFDAHMLVEAGVVDLEEILAKPIHDTNLLARLVFGKDEVPSYGLKDLSVALIDKEAADAERKIKERMVEMGLIRSATQAFLPNGVYKSVWDAYPADLEEYAIKDTRYTHDLFAVLMNIATPDMLACYEMERAVMPVLIRMEHTGIRIDRAKANSLRLQYEERRRQQETALVAFNNGEMFNPDSTAEVVEVLANHGVEIKEKTPSGQPKTDKWSLEKYKHEPVVDAIVNFRNTTKFLSTYIGPMCDRDTVHPNYIQIGAWTGRQACMRPNMQNVPVRGGTELREMIVPRRGYAFAVADYAQIEPRLLAYYMNDDKLWETIEHGDLYLWLGEQIYKTPDQEAWPVKRPALKAGYLAMTYGAGGPKLAQTIGGGMTDQEGRELRKQMTNALGPKYRELTRRIETAIKGRGYITTIGKRVNKVPRDRAYVGLNALIQGSASDILKTGLVRTAAALDELGGYPILTVHDEIVAEVPIEGADACLRLMQEAMTSASDLATQGKLILTTSGVICPNNYGEAK